MNRIGFLDYTKAWSIIFVIAIHVGFSQLNYAVLFVMPAFYIITGYGFNPDKRSVGKSISSRFKALMIPFWVFMIFYTLIELIRAPLFGYGGAEVAISSLANTAYGSGIIPLWGGAADYLKERKIFSESAVFMVHRTKRSCFAHSACCRKKSVPLKLLLRPTT